MTLNTTVAYKALKLALLGATTANQFSALIINYTHEEIMQTYALLPLHEQIKILQIWEGVKKVSEELV